MFKINYLEIKRNKNANKSLYKNLKPGKYSFHTKENKINFWGNHVNIQAIVGKNGSGKSSLMDLLYMAINNFAYMFERGHHRAAASSLFYVRDLYVDVNYTINETEYTLSCDGNSTQIIDSSNNKSIAYFHLNHHNASECEINDRKIHEIVKHFFYTIVSNYSLQSFISSNYICGTYVYNREDHKDDKPENVNSIGLRWDEERDGKSDSKEKIWLDSVFHKNDGYVRSLTLNPYRENGLIDMEREKKLAKYRLIALLIDEEKSKSNIFRDYILDRITFSLDEDFIQQKFPKYSFKDLGAAVKNQIERKERDVVEIIKTFNLKIDSNSPESQLIALAYLQKKINKIVENYDSYECFRVKKDCSIYDPNENIRLKNLRKLCRQIKKDSSHIATKAKQTINFLSSTMKDAFTPIKSQGSLKWVDDTFTYRRYAKYFVRSYSSIDSIIANYPPPIFKYEVYLNKLASQDMIESKNHLDVRTAEELSKIKKKKKGDFIIFEKDQLLKTIRKKAELVRKNVVVKWNGENWEKEEIKLSELSSGELQMMHTLSTHAYHIRNIMSVKKDQIKYHNINMVFDEVEICFHPEYQRQFIMRLLAMLNALCRFKQNYNFNIFVLTHSPFIISDIPSSNVLYMEDGKVTKVNTETFGQNISILLNQNFFLDFFVGDFAKQKINSLIDYLIAHKRGLGWNKETSKEFIKEIGDDFLKDHLNKKYKEVFTKQHKEKLGDE